MKTTAPTRVAVLLVCVFLGQGVPLFAEPDEAALGKAMGYPRGTATTMFTELFKVGSFSAADKILPSRVVPRSGPVTPLTNGAPATIGYRYQNARYDLADYLEHQRATGLLILKDGAIIAERYRYGRSERDHFLSFSVAKSITSLLVGIALEKGVLASLDDPAEKYVAELKGSGYGRATVRQLLRMSSGVKFTEEYTGRDDIARLGRAERGGEPGAVLQLLASFTERAYPAGEKLGYASSEPMVLGYVLARAARKNIGELTSEWLWGPLGAEADAAWNISTDGQEGTHGRFNATLRDYGRLGLLLARDGNIGGRQIVSKEYLLDATDPARQPPAFRPRTATPYHGYGYLFWLFPMRHRTFAMLGIYGQSVFVQPDSGIVMVQTSVNQDPRGTQARAERDALWRGVLESLGGHVEP
ncbi:MAG TPA: serine hydrolase [Verrucomicrobiae bacterium]|nr:serine hydrolase [Verrucomicrobiae bacterium]